MNFHIHFLRLVSLTNHSQENIAFLKAGSFLNYQASLFTLSTDKRASLLANHLFHGSFARGRDHFIFITPNFQICCDRAVCNSRGYEVGKYRLLYMIYFCSVEQSSLSPTSCVAGLFCHILVIYLQFLNIYYI